LREDSVASEASSPPSVVDDSDDSDDEYGEFEERKGKTTIQALKEKVEEPKIYAPTNADINTG
jgi:hypothetical protein